MNLIFFKSDREKEKRITRIKVMVLKGSRVKEIRERESEGGS